MDIKELTAAIGTLIAALSLYLAYRNSRAKAKDTNTVWDRYAKDLIRSHSAPISRFRYGRIDDPIPLDCTLNGGSRSFQLRDLLLQRATASGELRRPIVVLGEYGQGKTIASGAAALDLALHWQHNRKSSFIPVIIPLRDRPSFAKLDEAASHSIQLLYHYALPPAVIAEASSKGQLAIILDGLDEYIEGDDYADISTLLAELIEHAAFRRNQLILTSRPNAIEPEVLARIEVDCDIIRIQFPRLSQVYKYLAAHRQSSLLSLAQKPGNEHFADLIKRPLFLDMAVASADLLVDVQNVTQHKIYYRYFQAWYKRELAKLGPEMRKLSFEHVDGILSRAAYHMFETHSHIVSTAQLADIVHATSGLEVTDELELLRRQASRRLLLVPNDQRKDRDFTFRHDSLQSYFLARYLHKMFLDRQDSFILAEGLDSTTLSFFVTIVSDAPGGDQVVRGLYESDLSSGKLRSDMMGAALLLWIIRSTSTIVDAGYLRFFCAHSSPSCRAVLLAHLSYANLSGSDLSETNLSGASMQNANLSGSILRRTNLAGVRLEGADLTGAVLDKTVLDNVNLKYSRLARAQFTDIRSTNVTFQETSAQDTLFSSSTFAQSNFIKANCEGARLESCVFSDCDFAGAVLNNLQACSRIRWETCELLGTSFHGTECVDCSFTASNPQLALGLVLRGATE